MSNTQPQVTNARLYDHPKYYDVVFGDDWRAEFQFLQQCFREFVEGRCRRLLEPACGSGRLLYRLAKAGYQCHGLDLSERAVGYCNRRLRRHECPETAIVADMANFSVADFNLRAPFDAAFNTINSFRHLPSESAAHAHLKCVAEALRSGGIYVLGLHLTPPHQPVCVEESWSATRGRLSISTRMVTKSLDRESRREQVEMVVDVQTPTLLLQFCEEMMFRIYSAEQLRTLLDATPEFQTVATFDFGYELDAPIQIDESTEDVVLILRRR